MPSFTQLTREQRYQIYALRKQHLSQAEIARNNGVHRSTVCRELRRCQGVAAYQPEQSHQQALGFRYNAHKSFKIEGQLKSYLLFYLALDLSPEQISGTLQLRHQIPLSFQSIYRYLQRDNWWGGELFKQLRKVGRRYSYLGDQKRRPKCSQPPVSNRVSIRERPLVVERRKRLGDWEIDTIVGREHKSALLSITERKSQYLCLMNLWPLSRRGWRKNIAKVLTKSHTDQTGLLDFLFKFLLAKQPHQIIERCSEYGQVFDLQPVKGKRLEITIFILHAQFMVNSIDTVGQRQ
ncbi:hypothetical protein BTA51_28720 [Hahella sp. CCB-MM4]|uniref:IS30 family transposase n=1 Tax=Hahella sp. (strain CCB-MM4) TaxID=1926491 RepID=UPI000B9A5B08|nr:IS30 family transposase [Hahella sp. CCB-MM4]OZG69921.1 hypothetical protein BTA51_28720 [Hahella sp. CCB-MM4]